MKLTRMGISGGVGEGGGSSQKTFWIIWIYNILYYIHNVILYIVDCGYYFSGKTQSWIVIHDVVCSF